MSQNPKLPSDLDGRYTVIRELGRGGMGVVFLAEDEHLQRQVVIKCLLAPDDSNARLRALREGQVLANLCHENVIKVYAVGASEDGPYIVMEYMPGGSLADLPPGSDLLSAFTQIAAALDAVHAVRLLHRDVKPANILLGTAGRAVLADFGIVHDPNRTAITATGNVVGTMLYLAPEVLGGAPPAPAADWYGWGASVYVSLTGRAPYQSNELIAHVATGVPLELDLTGVPEGPLRMAIQGTLLANPSHRHPPSELLAGRRKPPPPPSVTSAIPVVAPSIPPTPSPPPAAVRSVWRQWLLLSFLGGVLGYGLASWSPGSTKTPLARVAAPDEPTSTQVARSELEKVHAELVERFPTLANVILRDPPDEILARSYPKFVSLRFEPLWHRYLNALARWAQAAPQELLASQPTRRFLAAPAYGLASLSWGFEQRLRVSAPGASALGLFGVAGAVSPTPLPRSWDRTALRDRVLSTRREVAATLCELEAGGRESRPEVVLLMGGLAATIGIVGPSEAYETAGCDTSMRPHADRILRILLPALAKIPPGERTHWRRVILRLLYRTTNPEEVPPQLRAAALDAIEASMETGPAIDDQYLVDATNLLYERMRVFFLNEHASSSEAMIGVDQAMARVTALSEEHPFKMRALRERLDELKKWHPLKRPGELKDSWKHLRDLNQ